ncbi:hypothetical protein ACX1C1_06025 [Paenibacillus sp. strain BS8-2]
MLLTAIIICCEIGFWVLVLAGLACRYLLRQKKLGGFLLILTPIVDFILIVATVIDLRDGATASLVHSLSAIYIGVSIAYGHKMIRWADERFAFRFAGGPAPAHKPKHGPAHAAYERRMWFYHLLAWAIGCLSLYGMISYVDDVARTEALSGTIHLWSIIVAIDFAYSFSFSLWPRKEKIV